MHEDSAGIESGLRGEHLEGSASGVFRLPTGSSYLDPDCGPGLVNEHGV